MKIYKYIHRILPGACLLLATLAATSCDNANDWTVDPAYNRLFSCGLSGVTPEDIGTEATLEFKTVRGAEYYLIEVSKDTLYNDIEMGSTATSIIYGEDKSIKESPYTMTGLDSSTKYYIRLKAVSSSIPESKWAYLSNYSFKTKSEQIFESVSTADLTENSVILHWLANAEVTKLEILKGEEVKITKDLANDNEAITSGTITIDGLEAQTNYTAKIYKNDIVRGTIGFTTFAAVPSADVVYRMTADESLSNELLTEITSQCEAGSSITIAMPAGTTYKYSEALKLVDGYSYTFFGIAGEKKPVIAASMITLSNNAFVKFQNVEINADGIDETGAAKTNGYVINQSAAAVVDNITFEDCDIIGFTTSIVRIQASGVEFKKVVLNGCYIKGGTSASSYNILHNKSGKFGEVEYSNTTFDCTGYRGLFYSEKVNCTSIDVKDCTVYNTPASGQYIMDFKDKGYGATNGITISNTIFAMVQNTSSAKGIRGNSTQTFENVWVTNDFKLTGDKFQGTFATFDGTTADLFENPAEGNFSIKSYNFGGRLNAGAKKWRMTE